MGLSAQAWVAILLAVWAVTGLAAAILLGRVIRQADRLEAERAARVLAENEQRKLAERLTHATRAPRPEDLPGNPPPPAYTGPRGRHHPDTSVDMPAVRADLADATGPMQVPSVPGAWTEDFHPERRASDQGAPAARPRPGGRRRSDARQTRSQARQLRDGEDPASRS